MPGLYVHVPFCSTLCPYCDFAVVVGRAELHERYVDAVLAELDSSPMDGPFGSIFIGGGTPTFVGHDLLGRLVGSVRPAAGAEVTIEANPDSFTVVPGVTRVSIGAQSFEPHVLTALGRTHGPEHTAEAVAMARAAGIEDVNLDLIYGAPAESDDDWARTLSHALALEPTHVSCYALTIEERTMFGTAVARGEMRPTDDDVLALRYEHAAATLDGAGFVRYEVSNWARPGYESRHNMNTWRQGNYLGVGLGAHSHVDGHRWWNTRSLSTYLADPRRARAGEEYLSAEARAEEWLSLGIRLADGIELAELNRRLGALRLDPIVDAGLARIEGGRLILTTAGMLMETAVTTHLLSTR